MIVIIHQAIGMAEPVEPRHSGSEDVEKQHPIIIITEDLTAGIPTGCDMVDRTRILYAQRA
jgi:hypothetical protein